MVKKQNCPILMQTVSLSTSKQMTFVKTEDAETRFDTPSYKLDRSLLKVKNKKVIRLMKDKLGEKNQSKSSWINSKKAYSHLLGDGSEHEKSKRHKKCIIKRKLKFENYVNCLEATHLENKTNYLEKNKFDIRSFFCYKRKEIVVT